MTNFSETKSVGGLLASKVVMITDAGSGIGRATSLLAAQEDAWPITRANRSEGWRPMLVCGGKAPQRAGSFLMPTVLSDVPDDSIVMTEEPFGPVVPLAKFRDAEDVIRRANAIPFGLAAYVFIESLGTARFATDHLETGMVNVNHFGIALAETPFGGVKDSGVGLERGQESFDGYLVTKFLSEMSPPY